MPSADNPPWAPDLERLRHCYAALAALPPPRPEADRWTVNPTLTAIETGWRGLADLVRAPAETVPTRPGRAIILCWRDTEGGRHLAEAEDPDLAGLKIIAEAIPPPQAAAKARTSIRQILDLLDRAAERQLVLRPPSRLARDPEILAPGLPAAERRRFGSARVFTLQWHITQACDLHCHHCYDRSRRQALNYTTSLRVLDDLERFCDQHHVRGQVSFSGGNPLLHPRFLDLYRSAAERGLRVAILGNPCDDAWLDAICEVAVPEFYQVSLEGLAAHNDAIRGPGHFQRVMDFLPRLRRRGIYAMVMLTLTAANVNDVLPLAEHLRDRADLFTFNRLAATGEGAHLAMAAPEPFHHLLTAYNRAAAANPILSCKDNLFNLLRWREGRPLLGGCAGHGCGAAFNFLALLPDGEVHACRKFPSPVGRIPDQSLAAIYHGPAAKRYRQGPAACRGCRLRHVCGGCLAVTATSGRDWRLARDPACTAPARSRTSRARISPSSSKP